jgi:hypothetical protein
MGPDKLRHPGNVREERAAAALFFGIVADIRFLRGSHRNHEYRLQG